MSLTLLCKSHKAGWGFLSTSSLHSEQLLKYPTTLFYDGGKNVPSFFQHNRRQHKTPCKPRWIQVSACTNTTKPNKKYQNILKAAVSNIPKLANENCEPFKRGSVKAGNPCNAVIKSGRCWDQSANTQLLLPHSQVLSSMLTPEVLGDNRPIHLRNLFRCSL